MGLFNKIATQLESTLMNPVAQTVDLNEPLNHVSRKVDGIYEYNDIPVIELIDVTKKFKTGKGEFTLFENLNFTIPDFKNEGQFISILGQSGAGKSQLLKIFSGLEQPSSGNVKLFGKPQKTNDSIPMVFQQYSSFTWLNVIDNISLPLKLNGIHKKERYERAMEIIKIVGLQGHEYKWTSKLSGGQQQRVAIARSLVYSSQIILLDEATSALDIKTKRELQDTMLNIFYNAKIDPTFISVTHNIDEAVYLSNRIYILQANPCKVHSIIDIDFGGKRNPEIRKSKKYVDYIQQIESIMDSLS
jgi:NitT/TauT family transport system ATP-binding protein